MLNNYLLFRFLFPIREKAKETQKNKSAFNKAKLETFPFVKTSDTEMNSKETKKAPSREEPIVPSPLYFGDKYPQKAPLRIITVIEKIPHRASGLFKKEAAKEITKEDAKNETKEVTMEKIVPFKKLFLLALGVFIKNASE